MTVGSAAAIELHLNVKHRSGSLTNSIVIDGYMPVVPREGERITLGDLWGFPEDRLTVGRVRSVAHRFTGNSVTFKHVVTVNIDEVDPSA